MAKVQIGAVIGVEGARQYKAQLAECTAATKNLASQTKLIEASFEGTAKSVKDLAKQKIALKGEIIGVGQKLATQRAELSKVVEAYKRGDENALKYKNQMYDLATETNKTEAEFYKLEQRIKELNQENALTLFVKGWEESSNKTGEALKKIGDGMTKYLTVPIVGGAVASVKVATDFQSAFTGVKKTVDEIVDDNGEVVYSYEQLEKELRKIPLETASSYETVMAVAEAAGQLGITADNISEFTKNIIMLGDSTNVSAEEGAVSIAQFLNIMGQGTETASQFGSALVELGNNTATDEASILALATRLASAGRLVGLSTADVLGLSAAMSAVGLTAEAGGTAMSTTMKMITNAVRDGGDRLQIFADITGTTTEEFAKKWRDKPIEAIQDLLVGFTNLEGGSEEMLDLMDDLGWAGIRQSDAVQRLTLNYKGVEDAVRMSNKAYEKNTALANEANKRYDDFATDLSQFKESVKQLADSIGKELIPALKPLVDKATELVTKFSEMDEETKNNILNFLGFVAIAGPVISAIGNLIIWTAKLKGAFGALKGAEGVGGVIETISGTGGKGGLISAMGNLITKGEELAGSILETVVPALQGSGMLSLGGALAGITLAYGGAYAAATIMDGKMHESAEACEYLAKRYHWTEEKVNEFGYTWDENGHLVALANQKIYDTTAETSLQVMQEMWNARQEAKNTTNGAIDDVTQAVEYRIPEVQSTSHRMVQTGVDEMRSASGSAYSYGSELGSNFASGISSQINNVRNAAVGIARAVQTYLHFSEPDEGPLSDFNSWMPDMMSQMAQGINDNIYMVENAMGNLTGRMYNQLHGNNNDSQGMSVVINVSGNNMDAMQVANLVEQRLTDKVRRVKYAY